MATNDEIDDLLQQIAYIGHKAGAGEDTLNANNLYEQTQIAVKRAKTQLLQLKHKWEREAQIKPFDFVEPCEPDCSKERHAYHQGQWDMAVRIEAELTKENK